MSRFTLRALHTPHRLPPPSARVLIALAVLILGIALLGIVIYDGVRLLAYEATFISIGMGNLVWGLGSLIPDKRGGYVLRQLSNVFFGIMLISLPVAFAYEFILN